MKSIYLFSALILSSLFTYSQLSEEEMVNGLKEALNVSTKLAVKSASKMDGFNKNEAIRILFPPEAKKLESTVRSMGMNKQADDFIVSLNRAAEKASKETAKVFINAIKEMDIEDGAKILAGSNTAATEYMVDNTSQELYAKCKPIVSKSIQAAKVGQYWEPLAKAYNSVPFVDDVNPDLEDYTTKKCIRGLFKLMAEEEAKIRTNPAARVTSTLSKVFGMF